VAPLLGLPPGWAGHERIATATAALGGEATYRVLSAAGPVRAPGRPDEPLRISFYIPRTLAPALAGRLAAVLASLQVVALPAALAPPRSLD